MKKKIAVIGNGWNNLNISSALKGIRSCTDKLNIDIFLFLSYAAFSQSKERNNGENAIFDLINYDDYDGVIIFSAMLDSAETANKIGRNVLKSKIPVVSVGMELEGVDYVGIENFQGMYEMVAHLVEKHNIKNPVFFAGPKTNVDSNERLEAATCALVDRKIQLPQDRIRYTDWEYEKSIRFAKELCKSDNPPDAYICANDNIAIATCIGLQASGVFVPVDAVVTGFDRIASAETFYPSITTVYQNYEKIGYMAAWHLLEKIEGNAKTSKIQVSSEYVCNESCGCKETILAESVRHKFCQDAYAHEMENILFQIHTSNIAKVLFECHSFDKCKQELSALFAHSHGYEGNNFYIMMDDNAMKSFNNSSFPLKKEYSETMQSIVAIENEKSKNIGAFSRKHILPGYKKSKLPTLYTITSLHYDDYLFGYLIMQNNEVHIADTSLNQYMLQMNSNLEKYRQNCQLDQMNNVLREISVRDQLTSLYNRFGLEQIGVPMYEKAKENKKKCAIIFTDINRMKFINDNFGHLHGDLAIKTVSSAVLQNLPEKWIGIRYGGDEFIAFGECENEEFVRNYSEQIKITLENQVKTMCLAYPLTASVGYIMTDPKSDVTLTEYINQADSIMYEHKQKTYEKDHK